jgi:LemA protein
VGLLIVFIVFVLVLVLLIGQYNGLIRGRNACRNAFAQIDVQLTRRHDLIPNLVETAKAYLAHERETLEAVISARNTAVAGLRAASADPSSGVALRELSGAEGRLDGALGKLMAVVESYPELKASANMMQLSEELTSTENRIAFARQAFNDAVMAFNNAREAFPSSVIANLFSFAAAEPLQIANPGMREVPQVTFR